MLIFFWVITHNNKNIDFGNTGKLGNSIFGMYTNNKSMHTSRYIDLEKEVIRGHLRSISKISLGNPLFKDFFEFQYLYGLYRDIFWDLVRDLDA